MNKLSIALAASAGVFFAAPVLAGPINEPVPEAAFITVGSLDWAWASPCNINSGCSAIDLTYQSTLGWRIPTLEEFLARPEASAFGDKCASAWFDVSYSHCDFTDPGDGYLADFGYNITPHGASLYSDTWLVRDSASGAVPEAATWALMLSGFGLVGAAMRRRKVTATFA